MLQAEGLVLHMAWIKTIAEEDATGSLAKQYAAAVGRAGAVASIVKLHSLQPAVLRSSMMLYGDTTVAEANPLPRWTREMIATIVSRTNDCFY